MYLLPAVGWEKVIKIRRFSNETAISVMRSSFKILHSATKLNYRVLK
ncbi:MAG: hypothetical protein LBR79_06200 [Oscillospiraceae bacterium]|nr:hypothetical protein [Oscillospiraceae bacterium]